MQLQKTLPKSVIDVALDASTVGNLRIVIGA
jgi:hypothetical protein